MYICVCVYIYIYIYIYQAASANKLSDFLKSFFAIHDIAILYIIHSTSQFPSKLQNKTQISQMHIKWKTLKNYLNSSISLDAVIKDVSYLDFLLHLNTKANTTHPEKKPVTSFSEVSEGERNLS